MRTIIIIGLILIYIILSIIDFKNHNIATGIAAFLLAIVNGLLFFVRNQK